MVPLVGVKGPTIKLLRGVWWGWVILIKLLASACRKKNMACSTNGKKFLHGCKKPKKCFKAMGKKYAAEH